MLYETTAHRALRVAALLALVGLWSGPAAVSMHAAWAAGFLWSMAFLRQAPWSASHADPLVFDERLMRAEP